MDSQRVEFEMSRQSYLTKENHSHAHLQKSKKPVVLAYMYAGGEERKASQRYMYLQLSNIEWQEIFKRLEKGREADDDVVFPLNPGKYVINDSMYICIVLCAKSASFAPKNHLTT